jgi:hypothetical protein
MKNKQLAYIVLVFAAITEYLHILFEGVIHSYYMRNGEKTVIYLSDMIYYFVNESFTLFLVIVIFLKIGTNKAAKSIMGGVCFWYLIEWIEIALHLIGKSEARLFINDGSWLQLFSCGTVVLSILLLNKNTYS